MDDQINETTEATIISTFSTLTTAQLSTLTHSLYSTFSRHRRRLSTLLSSPALFFHTLDYLYSLSLPQKSLLIARHLLSTLNLLIPFLSPQSSSPNSANYNPTINSNNYTNTIRLRDLDAVLLLLLFCEVRQHNPTSLETPLTNWLCILRSYWSDTMLLTLSGIQVTQNEVVISFIDTVTKCRRFVASRECDGGMTNEAGREVAASVAAVVALPSVEVKDQGRANMECVICKEEMKEGRDVCELPCTHLFHWICVLPWLRKRNTCPCCRFRLPTDDVYGEIERLWEIVVKVSRTSSQPYHHYVDRDQCKN